MFTTVIFSCTNDYDPVLIENLGMKERPLTIITKVLTTKSPNFMQEFTGGSVIGLHVVSENTGNIYDSNPDYKNVRAEACLTDNKLSWQQSPEIYLHEDPVMVYAYYPYQSQVNFDPENIPVRISADASLTKDYMYGIQASGQPGFACRTAQYEPYALASEFSNTPYTGSERLFPAQRHTDRK